MPSWVRSLIILTIGALTNPKAFKQGMKIMGIIFLGIAIFIALILLFK